MDLLVKQEIALHQHHTRTDVDTIKRLLDPQFLEVGQSGNSFDLEWVLRHQPNEAQSEGQIHSQDYQAHPLSETVVMLTYKTAWNDGIGNITRHTKRCSIWVLNEQQWQMRYHQGTPCAAFALTKNLSAE
jgi:hypothetical protein